MNRRAMLALILAAGTLPLVTACETVRDGDTTTHTLNVGKIQAYANAGLNAANTVATALSLNPAFFDVAMKVREVSATLTTSLSLFNEATAGELSISYNDYNWKTLVDSVLNDLDRLLNVIGSTTVVLATEVLGSNDSTVTKIKLVYDALSTLVAIFKSLVGGFITTASGPGSLSESEALYILRQ